MVDLVTAIICFTIGSLLTLKAYTKGLQHNYELRNNLAPKEEKNPIVSVIQHSKEVKQEKEQQSIIDEWINGAKE